MTFEKTGLPDCKIIQVLASKSKSKNNEKFNFIFHLDELRKRVSAEITRINHLFPEYTPHDEKYHLSKLFYIADDLLGEELIEKMNSAELFTFSAALYAHDWGMAITEDEKDMILSEKSIGDYTLIDDEQYRFSQFCKEKGISPSEMNHFEWQDYIRRTHAFRSAKRVKFFFEKHNSGLAEICSRLCEGHYVDFSVIDDPDLYPIDYSVLRESVNIKALALYLRLVDLLDLGEDRTPYVLWKFVAPRNKISQMEWAKHRALQPVSFPNYQRGRSIQIDGSTSDLNVYMSIMDLKRYVNQQFKESSDILNRMNHSYHLLNIAHIDWRIAARGFNPIPVQFEFDRSKMFNLLGDQIYQNDPYVFIRELLQNSIDAITTRKEVLKKKGINFDNGRIKISLKNLNEDYYKISVIDNGIGMDEYIIRNYLSVAGKSYYSSKDFKKEGLEMDPISRFGIGVLSYFMLSDFIEIQTFRDPYISNKNEMLKVTIPSKENYFRIESISGNLEVGTTCNILILKERVKEHGIKEFNIVNYIKTIAGFVEYPIDIEEFDQKITITKPSESKQNNEKSFSLSYDFPLESAILPQNISTAQKYFCEKKLLLNEDLCLKGYEGCLTLLLPKEKSFDLVDVGHSWPSQHMKIIDFKKKMSGDNILQWKSSWIDYGRWEREEISDKDRKDLSIRKHHTFGVYLNGILLPDTTPPQLENDYGHLIHSFLVPQLIVNIPKSNYISIDLARSSMNDNTSWDKKIWDAYCFYIEDKLVRPIIKKNNLAELYFELGKLHTFYKLPIDLILNKVISNINDIPFPLITEKNQLKFKRIIDEMPSSGEMYVLDGLSNTEFSEFISSYLVDWKEDYEGILKYREGREILALENYHNGFSASLTNSSKLIDSCLKRDFLLKELEFIESPKGIEKPWIHKVYSPKKKEEAISLLDLDFEDPDTYHQKIITIPKKIKYLLRNYPSPVRFRKPYAEKTFYSWKYLNQEKAFTKNFLQLLAKFHQLYEKKGASERVLGALLDKIKELPFCSFSGRSLTICDVNLLLNDISSVALNLNLISTPLDNIREDDFVPFSHKYEEDISEAEYTKIMESTEKWGRIID